MTYAVGKHTVLVTGGSGYLAGWTIIRLLKDGHRVRATLRDARRAAEVVRKLAAHAPTENLTFHQADLLRDAGWAEAAKGADRLLHMASPMPVREYKKTDLVPPAREGTLRAMQAAVDAGVPHIVVTSSVAAASPVDGGSSGDADWTDIAEPSTSNYARAKTLAERDAWEFIRRLERGVTLTAILPSMIMGPILGRDTSGSMEVPLQLVTGKLPALPRVALTPVHVADVAELHLRALDDPAGVGQRLILATPPVWFVDLAKHLKEELGEKGDRISLRQAPNWLLRFAALFSADAKLVVPELGLFREFDSSRAKAILGLPLRSGEVALVDSVRSLIDAGLA